MEVLEDRKREDEVERAIGKREGVGIRDGVERRSVVNERVSASEIGCLSALTARAKLQNLIATIEGRIDRSDAQAAAVMARKLVAGCTLIYVRANFTGDQQRHALDQPVPLAAPSAGHLARGV